jgi:transcriptional regulator with XRE-family HTH domain
VATADPRDTSSGAANQGGSPTARRIMLGARLRRLREAAEISRAEAGYAIRGSESKISRLELGRVSFKVRDVTDLLTMYGVTDPEKREAFLEMVARSNEPGWWHRYTDLVADWFQDYLGLEESASRIQTWEQQFIPGLMQTEDYAQAIATHGWSPLANQSVQCQVTVRMRRQALLARPHPPKLWAVIDESVLQRPIGGRRVLLAQIEHLLELTKHPTSPCKWCHTCSADTQPKARSPRCASLSQSCRMWSTSSISAARSTWTSDPIPSCTAGSSTASPWTPTLPTTPRNCSRRRAPRSERRSSVPLDQTASGRNLPR